MISKRISFRDKCSFAALFNCLIPIFDLNLDNVDLNSPNLFCEINRLREERKRWQREFELKSR